MEYRVRERQFRYYLELFMTLNKYKTCVTAAGVYFNQRIIQLQTVHTASFRSVTQLNRRKEMS